MQEFRSKKSAEIRAKAANQSIDAAISLERKFGRLKILYTVLPLMHPLSAVKRSQAEDMKQKNFLELYVFLLRELKWIKQQRLCLEYLQKSDPFAISFFDKFVSVYGTNLHNELRRLDKENFYRSATFPSGSDVSHNTEIAEEIVAKLIRALQFKLLARDV